MTVRMYFIYYIYVANTVLSGVPIVSMICYIRLFDRSKITAFVRGQYSGGNLPGGNCSGAILLGAIVWGAILLGGNPPGANYPEGNSPGGNPSGVGVGELSGGGNCPTAWGQLSGGQ